MSKIMFMVLVVVFMTGYSHDSSAWQSENIDENNVGSFKVTPKSVIIDGLEWSYTLDDNYDWGQVNRYIKNTGWRIPTSKEFMSVEKYLTREGFTLYGDHWTADGKIVRIENGKIAVVDPGPSHNIAGFGGNNRCAVISVRRIR